MHGTRLVNSAYDSATQCPLSICADAHVMSVSSSPLVKPYVGFSPVRLTDDLPHEIISNRFVEEQLSTELV